jgi:hypothetical protein
VLLLFRVRGSRRLTHIGPRIASLLIRYLAGRRFVIGVDPFLPFFFFRGELPFLLPPIESFGARGLPPPMS